MIRLKKKENVMIALTILRWASSLMTSAMSARMSRRVTAESRARAALTMVPRFTEEHGSSANSDEVMRIVSPARGDGAVTLEQAVYCIYACACSINTLRMSVLLNTC